MDAGTTAGPTIGSGDRLHDRFTVGEECARTDFGARRTAVDDASGETVHVTVLDGPVGRRVAAGAAARIADRLSAVRSAGIVPFLDGSGADEVPQWIATAAVPGRTLDEVLGDGPLPLVALAAVVADAAEGVAVLHAHGLVHGGISTATVLVRDDGTAALLETGVTELLGTIGAPVDAAASRPSADVFALGGLLAAGVGGEAARGAADGQRLPQPVLELLSRATAAATAQRPAASGVAALLRRAAADPVRAAQLLAPPVPAARSMGLRERVLQPFGVRRGARREDLRRAGVASAAVLGVAAVAFALLQPGSLGRVDDSARAVVAATEGTDTTGTDAEVSAARASAAAGSSSGEDRTTSDPTAADDGVTALLGATTAAASAAPAALAPRTATAPARTTTPTRRGTPTSGPTASARPTTAPAGSGPTASTTTAPGGPTAGTPTTGTPATGTPTTGAPTASAPATSVPTATTAPTQAPTAPAASEPATTSTQPPAAGPAPSTATTGAASGSPAPSATVAGALLG